MDTRIFFMVFITIGIGMIICIVLRQLLYAIYFSQLEIIVLNSYAYVELRKAIWQSRRG